MKRFVSFWFLAIRNPFRPRRASRLTLSHLRTLSEQFNLSSKDIEIWYEHFILCFPFGYVSFKEFIIYLQQLNISEMNQQDQLSKSLIKQIFYTLDFNKNKQVDFDEFFEFNFLINQGTNEEKLRFLLTIHDHKPIYYTKSEMLNILKTLFALFNISTQTNGLLERINTVLKQAKIDDDSAKICWDKFCTYVLNHQSSFEFFLSNNPDNENVENQ